MIGFADTVVIPDRVDVPRQGFQYLDVTKCRELISPMLNEPDDFGQPRWRTVNDFCFAMGKAYGIQLWKMLFRPTTYWSQYSINQLSTMLGVLPDELVRSIKPRLAAGPVLRQTQSLQRPQDFIHDVFQALVTSEMQGKRLDKNEYFDWLGTFLDCSGKTISNVYNGSANPGSTLVSGLARHFNQPLHTFYR